MFKPKETNWLTIHNCTVQMYYKEKPDKVGFSYKNPGDKKETWDYISFLEYKLNEKHRVFDKMTSGLKCQYCGQKFKKYYRSITWGMIISLRDFYTLGPDRFHHTTDRMKMRSISDMHIKSENYSGECVKLRHWNLLEPRKDNNFHSYWKITDIGKMFLFNKVRIPRHAVVYNNECVGYDGELISVKECMKRGFSFKDLTQGLVNNDNNMVLPLFD